MNNNDHDVALNRPDLREQGDNMFDPAAPFGPLELNLLERVENGLNVSFDEEPDKQVETPQNEKGKYEGPKEVIFVTGWVKIDSIYQRYMYGFIAKILIGFSIIGCLLYNNHNFAPVAGLFCFINLVHILKNIYYLLSYRRSNSKIRMMFVIEFHFSLSYFIYFLGMLLLFTNLIKARFFLLFSLPYVTLTLLLFICSSEDNMYLSQKKFAIFEGFQLLLIALKLSQIGFLDWNYTLIFFMTGAIYLTVIGLLLTIILSCSLFGFMYRNLEAWKLRSLIWMTWYYLWSGMIYIYVIKGVIQFYNEDNVYERPVIDDYTAYKSSSFVILLGSACMMIFFSAVNLAMHFMWKNDIKKYLAKIIYKDELRKEISLRFLTKSFTFQLIQISTTYFTKPDSQLPEKKSAAGEDIAVKCQTSQDDAVCEETKETTAIKKDLSSDNEPELCVLCYHDAPNIMIENCGHGGVCKECMLCYLKNDGARCPFCKGNINKLYLISYDDVEGQYYAKGEINLK